MAAPMAREFARWKKQCLSASDLSRKGSIDESIEDLVNFINTQESYFTTSSCSGRISVFAEKSEEKKKGCDWLLISHMQADAQKVMTALCDHTGSAMFKFEPFVLHAQCRTIQDARLMLQAAVQAGFRNSGITLGNKGKVMVAVRSTHCLEAPLSDRGRMLVGQEYVAHLVTMANGKLDENERRVQRFFHNLKDLLTNRAESQNQPEARNRRNQSTEEHRKQKQQQERGPDSCAAQDQEESDGGTDDLQGLFEGKEMPGKARCEFPPNNPGNESCGFPTDDPRNESCGFRADDPGNESCGFPADNPGNESCGFPVDNPGKESGFPADDLGKESCGFPADDLGKESCGFPVDNPGNESCGFPADDPGNESCGFPVDNPGNESCGSPVDKPGKETEAQAADTETQQDQKKDILHIGTEMFIACSVPANVDSSSSLHVQASRESSTHLHLRPSREMAAHLQFQAPEENVDWLIAKYGRDASYVAEDMWFNRPAPGSVHLTKLRGGKIYRCDQCDYTSPWMNCFRTHMFTHTGEKPYMCGECGFRTTGKSNLAVHMRKHTGEKPYRCDQCDYSAAHRQGFNEHMRSHTGEKPYMCEECGFRTAYHGHLSRHRKKHKTS